MKQPIYTNAAGNAAAGVARLRPGRGASAYQWHLGGTCAGIHVAGMTVDITESKLHFRWPGAPSS
jgi:hypothetical protein